MASKRRLKKVEPGTPVVVRWLDAVWAMDNPDLPPAPVATLGVVVVDNPGYLRVASEVFADGSARQFTTIPRDMICNVMPLTGKWPQELSGWMSSTSSPAAKTRSARSSAATSTRSRTSRRS